MGNAGNQFFQYAFSRMLQEKNGGELIIDYSEVHYNDGMWEGSDNLLKEFNTIPYKYVLSDDNNPHKLICKLIRKGDELLKLKPFTVRNYKFYLFCARHLERFGVYYFGSAFYKFRYPHLHSISIKGYFESPLYFEKVDKTICNELTPRHEVLEHNLDIYKKICESQSVCISVKRMDVDNTEISDVYWYDINYFYHAIEYIKSRVDNPRWVVFSDNIEWCRSNIKIDGDVIFETEDNPIWEKIRLMSSCKHFIIHNSTFSWWAQHLSRNEDKIVVAPVKWMQREDQPIDIYEKHFVYIDNKGNVYNNHL